MKKKLGGYQILDLTSIEIEELEDYTTITDADILQTLYEYLLPIVLDPTKELKPIYLRAVSDIGRSTVLCELTQHDAATFYIVAKLSGGTLRIGVGFEQDEETLEWHISSEWQYLSEQTQIEGGAISTIKAIETGTIKDVIGLDEDGEPVKSDSLDISSLKADEIIENMSGYSFTPQTSEKGTLEYVYVGVVKNGNKLTIVNAYTFIRTTGQTGGLVTGRLFMPQSIIAKIYPFATSNNVESKKVFATTDGANGVDIVIGCEKYDINSIYTIMASIDSLTPETKYYIRQEITILLSENLAS